MLSLVLKPHRTSLRAGTADEQKLFVMLKLIPQGAVAQARPPLAVALVIDSSGSMQEAADRGTKLQRAVEAAHMLIDDDRLRPEDRVALVCFDEGARTLLPLTPLTQRHAAHRALD